jgi:hypothetical protein
MALGGIMVSISQWIMPSAVESTAKSLVLERSSLYDEFMSGITVSASVFHWVRVLFTDRVKKQASLRSSHLPIKNKIAAKSVER